MLKNKIDGAAGEDCAAILPAQYFDKSKRRKVLEGEYRLLVAVLEEAIRSYLASMSRRTSYQRLLFEELRDWFYASRSATLQNLFAFESICELLGINAETLRTRLNSISIRDLPTRNRLVRHSLAPAAHRVPRQRTGSKKSAAWLRLRADSERCRCNDIAQMRQSHPERRCHLAFRKTEHKRER